MNAPFEAPSSPLRWPSRINEIPKAVFDREDVYQLELEKIFHGPFWHPLAHRSEVPEPGSFKSAWIGEMPVLVVHGDDGQVRVFYNTCTHRGTLLETRQMGRKSEFECPYHRWLFDTTGALRGCPGEQEFAPSFRKEDFGLMQVRSAEYCGMVFATASDETPDIEAFMGEVAQPLRIALGGDGRLKLLGYQKVMYDTNWKFYIDNDGYHAPLLHAAFKLLGWQGGAGRQVATEDGHLYFQSELKEPGQQDFLNDPSLVQFRGVDPKQGSVIAALMPITGFVKHLDVINVRFAFPRGVEKTEVHYAYYCHEDDNEDMVRHRLRQASNLLGPSGLVSIEDASVFHRLQAARITPGHASFQKGVKYEDRMWYEFKQNDEAGNLPKWEHYRRVMGFERTA